MTILGAINNILTKGDFTELEKTILKNRDTNNYSSLAAKASESIFEFPAIMFNLVDYDNAVIVTKACELSYAMFVEIVISMNKDMADRDVTNVSNYLRSFHDNSINGTSDSSRIYSTTKFGSISNRLHGDKPDKGMFSDPNRDKSHDIRGDSLDAEKYNRNYMFKDTGLTKESFSFSGGEGITFTCEMCTAKANVFGKEFQDSLKPYIENFCLTKLNDLYHPKTLKDEKYIIPVFGKNNTAVAEADGGGSATAKSAENKSSSIRTVRLDSADVKKANDLQPTMLNITIQRMENGTAVNYNLLVGVKTTLHLVSSDEFIANLVDACEYKGKLFRFIKWYTGEIEFIRDFVLNLDQFGKDVKNRAQGQSRWWDVLKRRARDAKISRIQADRLLPNATFVFTKTEADYVKANYGYDLMNVKVAKRLMEDYYLLGYVVLDMASEVAYILYDGKNDFQETTFKGLERENNNQERQFKEILRAARKM